MEKEKYWGCIVGFAFDSELSSDADRLMRKSIKKRYEKITGDEPDEIWSGWDLSEEKVKILNCIWGMDESESPLYIAIKNMLLGAGLFEDAQDIDY